MQINWKLYTLLVECKMMQPLWKTEWWFPTKLKIEFSYDSAIPLAGIYQVELKGESQTDTCK